MSLGPNGKFNTQAESRPQNNSENSYFLSRSSTTSLLYTKREFSHYV
jgi:hypothetical protein